MGWLWLGLAVVVIGAGIALLLGSRIHADLLFTREGDDDLFRVKMNALYGLIRYQYEIPFMYWAGIRQGVKIVKRETLDLNVKELTKENKRKINRHVLIERFNKLHGLLAHTFELHKWLISTMNRVRCSEVVWETKVGLSDAPDTAITTGLIWGVKTSLLGYVFRHVKLTELPRLSVVPLFNEERFETYFHCRLRIRLGAALLAGFQLMRRISRSKGGFKVWRNTLTKA